MFNLGLSVEKISIDEKDEINDQKKNVVNKRIDDVSAIDKRIGSIIRLIPSLLEGKIIRTRVDNKGTKKLVVKMTLSGDTIEINDLPFLYETIQRESKANEAEEMTSVEKTIETKSPKESNEIDVTPKKDIVADDRKGKTWEKEEEKEIERLFQQGKDINSIAEIMGRTEVAIKVRLAKLGLIDYVYGQDAPPVENQEIEHVYLDSRGNVIKTEIENQKDEQEDGWQQEARGNNNSAEKLIQEIDRRWNDFVRKEAEKKDIEEPTEKGSENKAEQGFPIPIGTRVRLLPSQIEGVVINHLISKSGERRIVIEKDDGSQMSAQDHPYLYEIVKKKRKRIGETRRDSGNGFEVKRKGTEPVNDGSIKEQFRAFLAVRKSESTTNGYTSMLDSSVRKWIKQEVDAQADSVFSYTTVEDVQICIDLLKEIPGFRKENDRKHNGLTAALNQYLLFIEEREKKI